MSARRKDPGTRRAELIAAATSLFVEHGVEGTAVSDIVKAADVAQGTFYLYFESKDAIVCAVAESLIDGLVDRIERAVGDDARSAPEMLEAMATELAEINDEPYEIELMSILHHPDNVAIHDRVTRSLTRRLMPHLTAIIEQGVAEGVFVSEDPQRTAWFILGALQGMEAGFAAVGETQETIGHLKAFVMRGLGYPLPAQG